MRNEQELIETIKEFMKWNRLRNDLDAYLYYLGQWAIEEHNDKPDPKDFGLE